MAGSTRSPHQAAPEPMRIGLLAICIPSHYAATASMVRYGFAARRLIMNSGCALQFIPANQNISRQIQPRCELAYHLQRERANAVQHLRDPGARAAVSYTHLTLP